MQVIAPDFYAAFGGKSSAREEERLGDSLFDALLRDEEARHARAALPPHEPKEAARPANDDRAVDETPPEYRDDPVDHEDVAEEPVAWQEAAQEEAVAEASSASGNAQPHDNSEAEADTGSKPESTAAGVSKHGEAPQSAAAAPAAGNKTSAGVAPTMPASGAATAASGVASTQAAAASGAPAGTSTPAAPAAPATEAAAATPATSTQAASGAAAAQRAADKAAAVATAKDATAAAQHQPPATASAESAARPSGRSKQATDLPGVVAHQTATLEARPAAALGGGAATAVLAQAGEQQAKAATAGEAAPTASDGDQPAAATKPAAQANPAAKATEMAAASDKAPGKAAAATAGATADVGSPQHGQPIAATATAGHNGPLHNTSFSEALAQSRHGTAANPADQIAVQVQRAQVAGQDHISIKLHPAELGRIEVKLENAGDGTLRAVISADRSDTLDLLQRDARGLERALQDAGVKTDSGSLNFSLRGQGQHHEQQAGGQGSSGRHGGDATRSGETMPAQAQAYRSSHSGALDIRV